MNGLKLGKRLNEGILSEVYRAEATGVIPGQATTTVVAKRAIHPPSDVDLKLLIKEVKILMFIGQHCNVVNLLGVVREKLAQRKLFG